VVVEPFAAVGAEVDDAEVAAEELILAVLAFTLLFTKRCSLASNAMVDLLGWPEVVLEPSVRVLRVGTVAGVACETKDCAGTSFTTFHLPSLPAEAA
jgi:hypothetical protein